MMQPRYMIGIAAALLLAGFAAPAQAQNSEFRELINKIERMQGELSTLQQTVYKGRRPPPPVERSGPRRTQAALKAGEPSPGAGASPGYESPLRPHAC